MALGRKIDPKVAEAIALDMAALDGDVPKLATDEEPPKRKTNQSCPDCIGGLVGGRLCTTCAGSGTI